MREILAWVVGLASYHNSTNVRGSVSLCFGDNANANQD